MEIHLKQLLFIVALCKSFAPGLAQSDVFEHCGGKPADVVFIVDCSSSIWPGHFNRSILPFLNSIVGMFDIGSGDDQTRVGAMTFSTEVKIEFHLGDYFDKDQLQNRIWQIASRGGNTATGYAISNATNFMFSHGNGSRSDVAHVAIVLTDGESQNRTATREAVRLAKEKGIEIFAIGVGRRINDQELSDIASDPDSNFKFKVTNFEGLKKIQTKLAIRTCKTTTPPPTTTTSEVPQGDAGIAGMAAQVCGGKPADIYFVVDTSSSIDEADFVDKVLPFLRGVVSNFDIGPDKTRVGLETFSETHHPVFGLNDYTEKDSLIRAINPRKVQFRIGGTNTADALRYVRQTGLAADVARRGVAHVIILVTDGMSQNPDETYEEAALAHKKGIYVFAIGVGLAADQQELRDMASKPHSQFVFNVSDFSALDNIKNLLAIRTCKVQPGVQGDQPEACNIANTDIVFFLDSATVGAANTGHVTEALHNVADGFRGNNNVNLGLMTSGCTNLNIFPNNAGIFQVELEEGQNKLRPRLAAAMKEGRLNFFARRRSSSNKRRAVIIVDKASLQDSRNVILEARRMKYRNEVFVVAVGDVNMKLVNAMVSRPSNILRVPSYETFDSSSSELVSLLC